MILNLESRKFRLIQLIMKLDNEILLSKIEKGISEISGKDIFHEAIKPIKRSLTLDELTEEQKYVPIKKDDFFDLAKQINIQEPIEDLLEAV